MALGEAAEEMEEEAQEAASVATATVEQTGTALIFHVGRSVDIPSDNSPHKTTIARDNLPCTFDYVSAPVLDEHVHLRATIHNATERVLLSGDTSIFLSSEYVGTTRVKTTAPTETFKIFLGIDDGIKDDRFFAEMSFPAPSDLSEAINPRVEGNHTTTIFQIAAQRQHETMAVDDAGFRRAHRRDAGKLRL